MQQMKYLICRFVKMQVINAWFYQLYGLLPRIQR